MTPGSPSSSLAEHPVRNVCATCRFDAPAREPGRGEHAVAISFWCLSAAFGAGAVLSGPWGLTLLLAWLFMASSVSVLVQVATCWTCTRCGAAAESTPQDVATCASHAGPPSLLNVDAS